MSAVVLYIDEEEMALHTMGKRLRRCFGPEVSVVTRLPAHTIEEMVKEIQSCESLVSIVIDQKLFAAGTATYVGTELAVVIRQIDRKIPIYILTNFVDDVDHELGDIEYVLAKDDLSDNNKIAAISARLARHVDIFQTILLERERKYEALLRKGYESTLTAVEVEEFTSLSYQRERKIAVTELLAGVELGKKLDAAEATLAEISALLNR